MCYMKVAIGNSITFASDVVPSGLNILVLYLIVNTPKYEGFILKIEG